MPDTQETELAEPENVAQDLHEEGHEHGKAAAPALDPETLARREAALAQVIKFGDPVLNSKASPVSEFDDALARDVERMITIMGDGLGVGLAATQLGVLRRLLVFAAGSEAEPTALINPRDRVAFR